MNTKDINPFTLQRRNLDVRLIEMLALDVKPHPNEVKKGDFAYWNNLASLIGIDLAKETAINDEQ
jgi:hypothetical protein